MTGSLDDYRIHVEKGIGTIYVDGDNVKNDTRLGQGDTELFCEEVSVQSKLPLRNNREAILEV